MEQKHAHVHSWLEKVFCGEEMPPYEVNSQTVDLLYQMAQECERKEDRARLVLEDLDQKKAEYSDETCRLKAETEWLGVSIGELTPTAAKCVKSLAEAALALDFKDSSDTSFCLALSKLNRERVSDSTERDELVRTVAALHEEIKDALLRQASQQKILRELSEEMKGKQATMDKQNRETAFLKQKTEQYHKQLSSMKVELKESGYDPQFSHGALMEKAEDVRQVQEQLAPLKAQLASFKDLPPDIDLARVKVEEARRNLVRLEAELAKRIDLVHAEK